MALGSVVEVDVESVDVVVVAGDVVAGSEVLKESVGVLLAVSEVESVVVEVSIGSVVVEVSVRSVLVLVVAGDVVAGSEVLEESVGVPTDVVASGLVVEVVVDVSA